MPDDKSRFILIYIDLTLRSSLKITSSSYHFIVHRDRSLIVRRLIFNRPEWRCDDTFFKYCAWNLMGCIYSAVLWLYVYSLFTMLSRGIDRDKNNLGTIVKKSACSISLDQISVDIVFSYPIGRRRHNAAPVLQERAPLILDASDVYHSISRAK